MIKSVPDLLWPNDPKLLDQAISDENILHLRTERVQSISALLPLEIFNSLVDVDDFWSGRARVVHHGREVLLDIITERRGSDNERGQTLKRHLATPALQTLTNQGAGLILLGVERKLPRVGALCVLLERHFRVPVQANCYAGFSAGEILQPHQDGHENLILHLHGQKKWESFGTLTADPAGNGKVAPAQKAEWQAVLQPGDILYMPRGNVHRATTVGTHSIHLTFSLSHPVIADVIDWLGTRHKDTKQHFAIPLKPTLDKESRSDRDNELKSILHTWVDRIDFGRFFEDQDLHRPPARPVNLGFSHSLIPEIWVQSALRRPVELPADGPYEGTVGGVKLRLNGLERAVTVLLLEGPALQLKEIEDILRPIDPSAVRTAVASLASMSLVFLLE